MLSYNKNCVEYFGNYDKTNEAITMFYNGDISYEELTKISSNVQLKPSLESKIVKNL